MPGIVVGLDGSDHSHRALIWAMRQAAQQRVPLTVLAVRPDDTLGHGRLLGSTRLS
jgi:nucleotide-binding universal stress UspA family protein